MKAVLVVNVVEEERPEVQDTVDEQAYYTAKE